MKPMSDAEERRIRGNVRFFVDKLRPWYRTRGFNFDLQEELIRRWNNELTASGLKPEPISKQGEVK
jgi:hypothetical protein